MNALQAIAIALIGGVPAIITAMATLLKVLPDAKKRRTATSDEHEKEVALLENIQAKAELLEDIKKQLAARESAEMRKLKKRVAELEKWLAESAQTKTST